MSLLAPRPRSIYVLHRTQRSVDEPARLHRAAASQAHCPRHFMRLHLRNFRSIRAFSGKPIWLLGGINGTSFSTERAGRFG